MKITNSFSCCRIATLTGITALLTFSITMADTPSNDQQADNKTEEMLVTARKREERQLDVPISITVFDQEFLSQATVDDISNLADYAPNVEFSSSPPISGSSNAAAVFIRGIGQNDFLSTNDPGVGIYLDGAYIARSVGSVLKIDDIERVEILRGPQGTLFGKNAIGGAIQLISKKPSDEFNAKIRYTSGTDNRQDMFVKMEGALSESLSGRISLLSEKRDGYVNRTLVDDEGLGNIDRTTAKGILHWDITDQVDIRLNADHTRQRQNAAAEVQVDIRESRDLSLVSPEQWTNWETFNTLIAQPNYGISWDPRWLPTDDGYNTFGTGPSRDDIDVSGLSLTSEVDLAPHLKLTSISSYREMEAFLNRDADGSPLPYGHLFNTDNQQQTSQELRLTSESSNFAWTTGLYFLNEDIDNRQNVIFLGGLFEATGGAADATFSVTNNIEVQNTAFFGQGTWDLTNDFSLTGGLRVTREKKQFFIDVSIVNLGVPIIGPEQRPSDTWTDTSPMLSANYNYTDSGMIYASYSEGFKGGGYNGRLVNPVIDPNTEQPVIDTFDPEKAKSYELGFKQQFQNSYLQGAIFFTDYTNMQVSIQTVGANNLIAVTIDNAAKAAIKGAELEFNTEVSEHLSFNTGIGYIDAEYIRLKDNTLLQKNAALQKVPEWNAHLRSEYRLPTEDRGEFIFSIEGSYKSKTYNDPINTDSIAQPSFTLVNGLLSWISPNQNWNASVFVNNLTDKKYFLSGVSDLVGVGTSSATLGRGRELGLSLEYYY